jgi:hypothetical protein
VRVYQFRHSREAHELSRDSALRDVHPRYTISDLGRKAGIDGPGFLSPSSRRPTASRAVSWDTHNGSGLADKLNKGSIIQNLACSFAAPCELFIPAPFAFQASGNVHIEPQVRSSGRSATWGSPDG